MSESIYFKKIEVEGKIKLGFKHDLEENLKSTLDESFQSRARGPQAGTNPILPENAGGLGDILEYKFSDKPTGELFIEGSGLVTSFGIFGAPGCGKTVLLMHLLKQILEFSNTDIPKKYGALILDPKAALIDDILEIVEKAGRKDDLVIINTNYLNQNKGKINIIDCSLDPYELGNILVLAGRSAGIDASDPFWFQEWSNLFASALSILRADSAIKSGITSRPVTIKQLVDALFNEQDSTDDVKKKAKKEIQLIAQDVLSKIDRLPPDSQHDVRISIQQINRFYQQDYVGTIEAFITKAFGMFRLWKYQCYSDDSQRRKYIPFYEDIIDKGKIMLVSISPSEPVLAKTLCTLIKCLFQRMVLSRADLLKMGIITNNQRPLVIACDEYSEIASEIPGQSMGDGQFLALARQYGCMALLATQSVNVLQASSLKESWRSVFSNFAAKIYMRLVDNETAEEATKLAGESDWKIRSRSRSIGQGGLSSNTQKDLRERKNLPTTILTQVLKRGQAVVIGSLDGGATTPGTYYLEVPKKD